MNKEVFDKLYKKVEGKLFNYNKIKDDIDEDEFIEEIEDVLSDML